MCCFTYRHIMTVTVSAIRSASRSSTPNVTPTAKPITFLSVFSTLFAFAAVDTTSDILPVCVVIVESIVVVETEAVPEAVLATKTNKAYVMGI